MGKLDDAGGLIARNEDIIIRRAFVRYRNIREFLAPHCIGPTAKKLGGLRRQQVRAERDLLRRRMYLVHKRAELITHLEILNAQNNLPPFGKKLGYAANRAELHIPERFAQSSAPMRAPLDLALIDNYDAFYRDRTGARPLPVISIRMNDSLASRYYVDPTTATLVESYSEREWVKRWLIALRVLLMALSCSIATNWFSVTTPVALSTARVKTLAA